MTRLPEAAVSEVKHAAPLRLVADQLSTGYGKRTISECINLAVPVGQITTIVGANACGKSTLLKTLARIQAPLTGAVLLDGKSIREIPTKRLATTLGLLPQHPIAPEGMAVADLVGRGRHPHKKLLQSWNRNDTAIVAEALDVTGTAELADRPVDELSGGQRQRVWIAMALAQQPDVLLLDEPTTFLDLANQVEVLDLLTDLNRTRSTTVVMVLHDINLAARYSDHMIAMHSGSVVASGTPTEVVTEARVHEVFGLESRVIVDPVSGSPLVVPRGRHHACASKTLMKESA